MSDEKKPWSRLSGLLLHLTSLPGEGGSGDLGPEAHRFLEQLARGGQHLWQVLPIGPTGYGDSPYQTQSIFAGNPIFVSPKRLADDKLLHEEDLEKLAKDTPSSQRADYGLSQRLRFALLEKAKHRLFDLSLSELDPLRRELTQYREKASAWLDDYALFLAIKEENGMKAWIDWPEPVRDRHPVALDEARQRLSSRIDFHAFVQWQFERQFRALRRAANDAGIELVGDVPIFVAHDSVEVWREREQFLLHGNGRLRVQAGVPPDYFSRTGQLWGNPLYDWERMKADGFHFWRRRMERAAALFDRVRIDHFRGFAAHWEIPGDAETAVNGRWVPVPGEALFSTLLSDPATQGIRYIAEDLGVITPDVEALRDRFLLPGIRVLVFGFGPDDHYDGRPWAFHKNQVVYTTTHDNETLAAWFHGESEGTQSRDAVLAERMRVLDYLGYTPNDADAHFALIRLALGTAADTVIIPVQDVLGLGNSARMNRPGKSEGNWGFRLLPGQLDDKSLDRLRELTRTFGRLP